MDEATPKPKGKSYMIGCGATEQHRSYIQCVSWLQHDLNDRFAGPGDVRKVINRDQMLCFRLWKNGRLIAR